MLQLDKRPCKLGAKVDGKKKANRDDIVVPVTSFKLSGIIIDRDEMNALVDEELFYQTVFNAREGDKLPEPLWTGKFAPLVLHGRFSDCTVVLYAGLKPQVIELSEVTLTHITVSPQIGGQAEVSATVKCTAEVTSAANLWTWLDQPVDVEIAFGPLDEGNKAQPELNLQMKEEPVPPARKPSKKSSRVATH